MKGSVRVQWLQPEEEGYKLCRWYNYVDCQAEIKGNSCGGMISGACRISTEEYSDTYEKMLRIVVGK